MNVGRSPDSVNRNDGAESYEVSTWKKAMASTMSGHSDVITLLRCYHPSHRTSSLLIELAMPSIVLTTLNARYHHCAFGLRYLMANMGDLRDETTLLEFTINQPTLEILDTILSQSPRIVGLGVYIWNVDETA
jgi:hypothetical protein